MKTLETVSGTYRHLLMAALFTVATACSNKPEGCNGDYCGTLVIAAPGEPNTLLPPMTNDALDRDIYDQIYLKLADVGPDAGTVGDVGFEPQLASKWEWVDSTTLNFTLDQRARWHDGRKVSAADVVFSFRAYTDTVLASPNLANLKHIRSVLAMDSAGVVIKFDRPYPEMFFDAVHHVRILPAHILDSLPRDQWQSAAFGRAPVGAGPYRFVSWTSGQSLELAADSGFFLGRPYLQRLIWRFSADLNTAVTQLVAGEADAIPVLATPPNYDKATKSGHLTLYPYPGSVYAMMGFNLRANGDRNRPHPIFGDGEVRRALQLALDREKMAQSVFAGHAKVPPGPLPQSWKALWWADNAVPSFNPDEARKILEQQGWRLTGSDSVRSRAGTRLSFHLVLPGTSAPRKQYGQLIQEQLRAVGVEVVLDLMENATIQEKQAAGKYDAALEAWTTDPTPSAGIPPVWTTKGPRNTGRYSNPVFDSQVASALNSATPEAALSSWHDALKTLAHDTPAIMLYALDNVAAVDNRFTDVRLRPDYWWAYLRTWRIPSDKLNDRDRAAR